MPKKRANSRTASSGSASSAASSSTNRSNSNSTTTTSNTNTTGGNDGDTNNNSLPIPGNFIGGMQLTPAMVREFMEASKKAGIDHNGGIVNQRGNSRHVTGDLNKLVAMANASSNTAAAAAAAAAAGNNKGGGNTTTNSQAKNTNTSRGKVTGVKIVRQTVPFVGPPPPPGHASSNAQKGGGPQKPVAMGVSATFSKADGSTATVDLDAAAIASMMSQANSNNPEAFNAGLKQILAAASSAAAAQQSSSSSGSSSQQQQQTKQSSAEASYNAMSALSASCPVGKRNALLANKIASSYGSLGGEDDNSKSTSGSSSGNNSKTSSKKKSSSSNNTAQQQHQQNTAQIQSLFSSLFNMAQQMDTSGSSSSTTTPSQESIQNDFASFRKAAFVAGVNVAIQQEAEREAQHEMEKMNQQKQKKQSSSKQEAQKSVKQKQQSKSKKKEGGSSASSATATAKSNVFSMIFGGGGSSKSKASSSSSASTSSSTNKNGSSTTSTNSASAAVVPIIPPPPGGFPQDSLVAQAASVLADYGTNASDDDENLNLAVSLGNRLLKSVNMSLDTEDDARRAYEKVTSCLSAEERNIVDSFATNFADLPDDGGVGGGFGCLPEELLNVMSKSMASVMNLDNPGVMERLAQEMDRVKKVSSATTTTPPPQDRPTFEHLPDDDKTRQHKNEQEAAAREKAKAEEEERKRQEEAEEEERKRELKASKRRDKKARQKERLKKEAELKAAAAAIKKRERTITSWRSRVIAACASGDARKMNMLIGESPYRNYTFTPVSKEGGDEETNDDGPKNQEEYLLQQLNWFLPNCLQKYQTRGGASFDALPFEFNVARELLAKYILSTSFDVFREPVPTYSRTCIHSAAYANDVDFIKWVLQSSNDNEKGFLETPCTDAGWTPLHYATAGGAKSALELLMAEKCNVKARSNPSLTCFRTFTPYQSSNGLTARELAVVLQAGAVDDDLTSKAAILDEIVDKRIVNVTAADKTSYMRILKAIEERLKEVEKNGYWPLPEDEEQIALIFEETPSESTTSAAPKKKSKKKNKKKAKETNPPPAPPAASPEPEVAKGKSSSGDDLSDPVAVALLGMGFSEEQIKAAAKAFGGYVGADDMVMWILSGGDTSSTDQSDTNSQQNSQARSKDSVSITSSTKSFTTKAQTKALTRAQKKVEEAARKHQEEIANAQKAAAKREEQRRLRREWNEREQARQQEEKNAKLAKALERQRQAEMEKMMADMPKGPPGPGGIPMSINIGGGGGGGGGKGGPPMTIVAGGKKASKKSNMGIPQAPTVKAPKILARPSDASKGSAGNQPLFTKPAASSKSSSRASKPGNPSTHQPTMILKKGAKPQPATKGISASAPEFRPPGVSDGSISSVGSAGKQTFPAQKSVAKKVVPPGFQPAMPGKASDQPAATPFVEPNHMGLIRATAREFVPSFAPSPVSEENVVPSMSAQSSGKRAPAPQPTASSNESASNAPAAAASLIEPMSSLLSNVSSSPAPPTTLTQTVGVDPTVSAASSITGLSGTLSEEKPPTSRVGSIMTFESNTATGGGLQGSSILESISYGATADHHQSNGLGNIWGGGGASNTNQTDTLGGLGGFDFSSFMQDDALSGSKNDNRDTKGNTSSLGGNALGNNTWGGNGAIGGDSIW